MKQLVLDLASPAEPTLDNFVAGPNAEALQAMRDLAAGARRDPVIYLFGPGGSGRTHLLRAVAARCAGALYVTGTADDLVPETLPDVVAWDDVQRLDAAGQARLFGLLIRLREAGGLLLCAGDVAPAQLPLRADVVTRLAAGMAYRLQVLADDEKAEAVTRHAAQRGFQLGREVVDYLLRRHARDLPALIRMLEALDRYSLETKRAVTVPLVRELLMDARAIVP